MNVVVGRAAELTLIRQLVVGDCSGLSHIRRAAGRIQ